MPDTIKAVIVTNVPVPYRIPTWQLVSQAKGINLELIFCAPANIDTSVELSDYDFNSHFLSGKYKAMERRFMHCDFKIWRLLNKLQPNIVITTGYIPTFLFAFLWAVFHNVPHVAMTDGTADSEKSLSWLHRLVRWVVLGLSSAFVGACKGSSKLFLQYGVPKSRIHKACLCTDNEKFSRLPPANPSDFIYCGRFVAHKRPLFALQVAQHVATILGRRTSIDFVGSGSMESALHTYAKEIAELVDCRFLGYASQAELPQRYADAKIFLFPSEWDPWGVVANEACASGLPVIVSPHAGVAGELIVEGKNGYIRELDIEKWVEAAVTLLTDDKLYLRFSQNSRKLVAEYNFDASAQGLIDAIKQADDLKNKP